MKIKTLDEIESMHQWLDDDAVLRSVTIKFPEDALLDSETLDARVVDADGNTLAVMSSGEHEKWFARLVKIGVASEDLSAPLNAHPANEITPPREVPREEGV